MVKSLLGQLALALAATASIVVVSQSMEPVYAGRAPVMKRLAERTRVDSTAERAPWAVASTDSALQSARFAADRLAFAVDLVGTGRVDVLRADSLATFAVQEAYRQKVPPALVFGVLLTENATFKSRARSNVGAVGLMQIYPKYWVPTLGKRFGRNLRDDQTNLRYGVHILRHYVYGAAEDAPGADAAVRTGLLRYNGCVRGTNTKDCHRYPDKVRRAVEEHARAQCTTGNVTECVEQPLQLTLAMAEPRGGETRRAEQ